MMACACWDTTASTFLPLKAPRLLATDDGRVAEVVTDDPSGFGNYVKLEHAWGESIYAHMHSFNVRNGQVVRRGTVIGLSGSTGFSDGPHLHFSIRIHPYERTDGWGGFSDPLPYLNPADFDLPVYVLPPVARALVPQGQVAPPPPRPPGVGMAPDQPGVRRP